MKLISTAFALVAAGVAVPAIGQTAPQPAVGQSPANQQAGVQIKPSPKAAKAIVDLQTAVNNKDYASIPAKVAAAQAVASTKEDRYLIGTLQLRAAVSANDVAATQSAIDAVALSGYLDPAKTASLYISLGGTYYKNKQFPQAAAAFQKAAALDPGNAEAADLLGRALYLSGQKAEAAAALQKLIQASTAAGHKPTEDMYRLAVQAAYDSKSPDAPTIAQEWLAAYPSADSLRTAITIYRAMKHPDAEGELELYRLLQMAGALTGPDYGAFIMRLADQNNYNEAKSVLDAGIAAKAINTSDADYRDLAAAIRSKPIASAADLAVATKTAVNGTALLHIGDRYYAMGDYAKALEVYRLAKTKPAVDPEVVDLHIGTALARSGDKAGAVAAFSSVKGAHLDIAKFWLSYLNQKA
jgi:tetratricopeptide (TPR) repeat protein